MKDDIDSLVPSETDGDDLQFSSTRLKHLLNSTPSVIYSTRAHGDFACTYVNDNVFSVLGYSKAEMLADTEFWTKHIHPDDRERVLKEFSAQIVKGGGILEYRFEREAGQYLWIHDSHRLIGDDDGRPVEIIGSWTDITHQRELSEQLVYEASHDSLTGLVNRREFEKRLEKTLASARARKFCAALCYLDLDQFKVINDSLGHLAGDQLLSQLGAVFGSLIRDRDTLARLGGDEFGLILQHCLLEEAEAVANMIRREVEAFRFTWEGETHQIGVSIGVALIDESCGTANDILKQADSACYMAKEFGRARVYVYRDGDGDVERRQTEMTLVSAINHAIEEDGFVLFAQSIVPIGNDNIGLKHFEILLRMKNATGDLIAPSEFLGAAERYGLSARIDRWVVQTTLNWLSDNVGFIEQIANCSINLSGHTLTDAGTIDFIESTIRNSGIAPNKLCFEITETAAVSNLSAAIEFIDRLRDIGCRFALDDFGSGFSSFAYLSRLPVDYLKIDGGFVRDISSNTMHHAFVRAINDIAHVMNLETIAEFVEDDQILIALRALGVDYAQGYGIDMPGELDLTLKP